MQTAIDTIENSSRAPLFRFSISKSFKSESKLFPCLDTQAKDLVRSSLAWAGKLHLHSKLLMCSLCTSYLELHGRLPRQTSRIYRNRIILEFAFATTAWTFVVDMCFLRSYPSGQEKCSHRIAYKHRRTRNPICRSKLRFQESLE